ncbi:cysteine-rich repeat secretory protein 8, partial [Quercus suber]
HNVLSSRLPSLSFTIICIFVLTSSINSQLPAEIFFKCTDGVGSSEPSDEDYRSNLATLLDSFLSKPFENYSFDNSSYGGIYGFFLCRGDVSNIICQNCIKVANYYITRFNGFAPSCNLRFEIYPFIQRAQASVPIIAIAIANSLPSDNEFLIHGGGRKIRSMVLQVI